MIKVLIIAGLILMLTACGGDSSTNPPVIPQPSFYVNSGSSDAILQDQEEGRLYEVPHLVARYLKDKGETLSKTPTWDSYPYTGTIVGDNTLAYKKLWESGGYPPSFIHSENGESSSFINTDSFEYQKVIGGGNHTVWTYAWGEGSYITPWKNKDSLVIEFELKIPYVEQDSSWSVGQMSFVMYAEDKNGTTLVYLINLYDSRLKELNYSPVVSHDTFYNFLSTPWVDSEYLEVKKGEHKVQAFKEYTSYKAVISKSHIDSVINEINKKIIETDDILLDFDVGEYKIRDIHLLHEVITNEQGHMAMGVAYKNIKLY